MYNINTLASDTITLLLISSTGGKKSLFYDLGMGPNCVGIQGTETQLSESDRILVFYFTGEAGTILINLLSFSSTLKIQL